VSVDLDGDKARLYRIFVARDRRYDGRVFCAVHTTGIYCRPICPARAKIENVTFFRSGAEAERAGFRACLRCRPDIAPQAAQWSGTGAVVGRALDLIARGEADDAPLSVLAAQLGISDRHLRRLFDEHLGAAPVEVAASKRLHLARQLLTESSLSITHVAFASGYRSLRRFNEAFKERFHVAPRAMRRGVTVARGSALRLVLPVVAPYDWESVLAFLGRHATTGIEAVADGRYRRAFAIDGRPGAVEVAFDARRPALHLTLHLPDTRDLRRVVERVRDLFDARTNPHARHPGRGVSERRPSALSFAPGTRVPGAWDPFETAVATIVGQAIRVEHARVKMGELVARFGEPLASPLLPGCTHLFPTPPVLATADLSSLGLTRARSNAIRELARRVANGELQLSRSTDLDEARRGIASIPGVGPWTVEMVAMRCLGDPDAFPDGDLILRRALEGRGAETEEHRPWRAYLAVALWGEAASPTRRGSTRGSSAARRSPRR